MEWLLLAACLTGCVLVACPSLQGVDRWHLTGENDRARQFFSRKRVGSKFLRFRGTLEMLGGLCWHAQAAVQQLHRAAGRCRSSIGNPAL